MIRCSVNRFMTKTVKKSVFSIVLLGSVFMLPAKPKYISPNSGGPKNVLEIPLKISDKRMVQGWSLVIMDSNHKVVRTIENKVALPTKVGFAEFFKQLVTSKTGVIVPNSITWNGAMDNGETAPDGLYYYYITATDDNGNVGKTKEYEVIVDTLAPEIELMQPSDKIFGEGAKSSLKIKQTGSQEDEWVGVIRSADGSIVKTYKWKDSEPLSFSWNGTNDDNSQVPDGVYSYEITATDRAGNIAPESVISNIIYSADKPVTNILVSSSRYFSPGTESVNKNVMLDVTIPVPDAKTGNSLVEWSVTFKDKKDVVVKEYNQNTDGPNPPSSIIFDGIGKDGKLLADGEYKAYVSAKYLNGYVPAEICSPVIVLDTVKPSVQIAASDKVFGAGSKSSVKYSINIAASTGAPVPAWNGEIKDSESGAIVKTYNLGEFPPESITWNGICDNGSVAPKGQYIFSIKGTDLAGNEGGGTVSDAVTFDTTETELLLAANDVAFSPNGDSIKDSVVFTPITQTKDVVSYEFAIKNAAGTVVYSENENKKLPVSFNWKGVNNSNKVCEDGSYTASLTVTAANGSTATASSSPVIIDTVKPTLTAQIPWYDFAPDGNSSQTTIPVAIKDCSNEKLWNCDVRNAKDKTVKKFSWNGKKNEIIWDGSDESGNLAQDGKYSIILYTTDDAGNSFSTEIKDITLDTRETKVYLTAEHEGISPNGDNNLENQKFEISSSVTDSIKDWNFNIRKEDGSSVYVINSEGKKDLPAVIEWNGKDNSSKVCEGTFTGTIEITYKNGKRVSSVSSPFVCTAIAPELKVQTSPDYFSPDNDGIADELYITLAAKSKARFKNWSFVIKDPKGKDFWKLAGKNRITEKIVWDGLSNVQKDSHGKAERVQSAMDYPYEFTVTDNLGMTSVYKGFIPVDVLVIRDGNVLKMAVPSIIFESDASNFQNANAKLNQSQIDNNLKTLNRIADILKKFKDYKVTIVGHANKITDNPLEETEDNLREWGRASMPLSKERADAIKTYLTKHGVNASVLTTDGKGGTMPVVNPKDKDNNWKNRRVEFILEK